MARKDGPEILDDDVDEMREELEQAAEALTELRAEKEKLRKALIEERDKTARLREQTGRREETRRGAGDDEERHVIDAWGRLRRAWRYPNFRLFVFMLALFGNAAYGPKFLLLVSGFSRYGGKVAEYGPQGLNALCIALFLLWGLGQFRRRGLASVLLKWAVFFAALALLDLVRVSSWSGELVRDWRAIAGGLAVVMVLTFTKISEWLGRQIRVRVWQTRPVAVVKGWF
jgi:hypothetical protein